jgi:hypothetical protein
MQAMRAAMTVALLLLQAGAASAQTARDCLRPAAAVGKEELERTLRAVAGEGEAHWEQEQLTMLVAHAREGLVRLATEREAAAAAVRAQDPARARSFSDDAEADRNRAKMLSAMLKGLGLPAWTLELPSIRLVRVALVSAADAPPAILQKSHVPFSRLDGKIVTLQYADDLAKRPAPILYLAREPFVADLNDRSAPALARELRRRLREGATPAAYAAHILALDIDQAGLALTTVDRVRPDAELREIVAAFADAAVARVQAALTAQGPIANAPARLAACRQRR